MTLPALTLTTSGSYTFQAIEVELVIREAFERIGILGEFVEPQKLESARRSINLLLLDWMNRKANLWTLKSAYLGLITGQPRYELPYIVSDIIQVNLRTSSRQNFGGVARSNSEDTYDGLGGGNADFAFDGNPETVCVQTDYGNISYDYGVNNTQYVTFVGITSGITANYELVIESCPSDPTDLASWQVLLSLPINEYKAGITYFFDIPTPVNGRAYRVRALDTAEGAEMLHAAEIYFNNNAYDFPLSDVSRYEYYTYPNKYLVSRPSVYYLDRQLTPVLNIWPTPSSNYNCLFYSYKQMMQNAGLFTNTLEIPSRFYPPLIWGLSWHLALKFNPQIAEMLEAKYEQSFRIATTEDSENVDITIKGD